VHFAGTPFIQPRLPTYDTLQLLHGVDWRAEGGGWQASSPSLLPTKGGFPSPHRASGVPGQQFCCPLQWVDVDPHAHGSQINNNNNDDDDKTWANDPHVAAFEKPPSARPG